MHVEIQSFMVDFCWGKSFSCCSSLTLLALICPIHGQVENAEVWTWTAMVLLPDFLEKEGGWLQKDGSSECLLWADTPPLHHQLPSTVFFSPLNVLSIALTWILQTVAQSWESGRWIPTIARVPYLVMFGCGSAITTGGTVSFPFIQIGIRKPEE